MKINIATNIRNFRKQRKLTQEQLAEVLGVTLGAVSKWELGASTPDLALIIEMADFFETSVDILLGYEWYSDNIEQMIKRIRNLRNEKKFDEASAEAEKAIQKHPNSFEIVYQSAIQYSLKGVEYRCQKSFQRSLALFDRSLELIGQNTDECTNEWTIRNNIAEINLRLGKNEEALEQMKKNNADGLNNGRIGTTLTIAMHRPDEALGYLSDALINYFSSIFGVVIGYANAYCQKKDYASADAIMKWMHCVITGLKRPSVVSYLDKAEAQLLTDRAIIYAMAGNMEQAKSCLAEAITLAEKFDEQPEYGFSGIRFFHSEKEMIAFDDFGKTAVEGIRKILVEEEEGAELLEMFTRLTDREYENGER